MTNKDYRWAKENETAPALSVRGLDIELRTRQGSLRVVNQVSFDIERGETLALVGESGSGKTLTARSVIGLLPSGIQIANGTVKLGDRRLDGLDESEYSLIRGKNIGMVFQEPRTAFDPLFTIGYQLTEGIIRFGRTRKDAWRDAIEMLGLVGISAPELRMDQFPHQLSGGMLQRAMIAGALLPEPDVLILDEPTTGLDVSIQGQIIDLVRGLRGKFDTAILLITHDLGVVAALADRVAVMYASRIVETGASRTLFDSPRHPYTQGLLAAVPGSKNAGNERPIGGLQPAISDLPTGCTFHTRCPHAFSRCVEERPPLLAVGDASRDGDRAACWLVEESPHETT